MSELLRVENLEKHFPVRRGIVFQKQVAAVKANRYGRAALRYDSRRGDVFPCGATIDALAGMRVEVRDDDRRLLVIVGSAPMLKSAAAFRFIETEVMADDFDADATGVFPTGWAATGASVTGAASVVPSRLV